MNRIDSLLRFLAVWPQGRLHLVLYVDRGEAVAFAVDVDRVVVLKPVRAPTVDDCVVALMQQAMQQAFDALDESAKRGGS